MRPGSRRLVATPARAPRLPVLTCVPSALDAADRGGVRRCRRTRRLAARAPLLGGDWVGVDLPRRLRVEPADPVRRTGRATEIAIHGTVCRNRRPAAGVGPPFRSVRRWTTSVPRRQRPRRRLPGLGDRELWVGGAGVSPADFRNDPHDRTAARFVTRDGLRWYHAGDLARLARRHDPNSSAAPTIRSGPRARVELR